MKKRLWNRMHKRLSMCMTGVLLALGIATGSGGATPVQAAEKIPVSSAEDLMNMESNPSGSYYLTGDITLPENMQPLFTEYVQEKRFSGTLDGRGHKLKNYTIQLSELERRGYIGIFGYANNATFKNLSLMDVNININAGEYGANVGSLIWGDAEGCTFDNIRVSGKITVSSTAKEKEQSDNEFTIGGLIVSGWNSKLTNCSSSLKINVDGGYADGLGVGGLAGGLSGEKATVKNCSFSGDISANAKIAGGSGRGYIAAGICAGSMGKVSGCTNSGNITLKIKKGGTAFPAITGVIGTYGIGYGAASMSSCGNSGKIKADSDPDIEATAEAAGLETGSGTIGAKVTKCWNKGSQARAGGLFINAPYVNQCYNKGDVFASSPSAFDGESEAGGVCVSAHRMQNCYNVGKVTLKGAGYAGGLASLIKVTYSVSTSNYSTGAVSIKSGGPYSKRHRAALFPRSGEGRPGDTKCYVYNNYYTASTGCTAYGLFGAESGNKKSAPRATKVSSITSKNCPKLSSKYWTYSSKYKRMILKNNKEK